VGKQRIFQLLQTLKDLEEMELQNAAKIYTIAHIATGTPVDSKPKPKPKKLKG
jgi:hypothetical protein